MMTSRIKIGSDMLRPFSDQGDVVTWEKKVKLVAKLQAVASLLSLYLERSALNLYLEMSV